MNGLPEEFPPCEQSLEVIGTYDYKVMKLTHSKGQKVWIAQAVYDNELEEATGATPQEALYNLRRLDRIKTKTHEGETGE